MLDAWRRHLAANRDALAAPVSQDPFGAPRILLGGEWEDPAGRRLGGAAAWALVRMGNSSAELVQGLWQMLQGELSLYDRRLVEVTLQALRPRGSVLWSMFAVATPPLRPEDSSEMRGSALAVLPWSVDFERPRLRSAIDELLQSRKWPRSQRVKLTSLRHGLQATPLEVLQRTDALIEKLRQHVLTIELD